MRLIVKHCGKPRRQHKIFSFRREILPFRPTYSSSQRSQRTAMAKTRDPKRFERTAKGRRVLRQRTQIRRATQNNDNTQAVEKQWSLPGIAQGHPFFNSIPHEMRNSIMSLLPLKDVEASHQACQQFYRVAEASNLAGYRIQHHLHRIQSSINTINAARMPTDAVSLLASMRIWISTRGLFHHATPSFESWTKWFSHLANGDVRAPPGVLPPKPFEQWAYLAHITTGLQLRVDQSGADCRNDTSESQNGHDVLWYWFHESSRRHAIPIDVVELFSLYLKIRITRVDRRAITGTWHSVVKERATFPGNIEGEVGRRRLTPIRFTVGSDPNRLDSSKHPYRRVEIMLANMDLPPLPPHNTFCYYITNEEMYAKIINSSPGPLHMTPAMRAEALACVKLF